MSARAAWREKQFTALAAAVARERERKQTALLRRFDERLEERDRA